MLNLKMTKYELIYLIPINWYYLHPATWNLNHLS
jgi:hypothetical protein